MSKGKNMKVQKKARKAVMEVGALVLLIIFGVLAIAINCLHREAEKTLDKLAQEEVQLWLEHMAGFPPEAAALVTAEKEPVEVEPVQSTPDIWTDQDIDDLCHLVMAEAEGEPFEGKIAVVNVVLNRCRNRGMTIHDVIFEPNQFCTGKRFKLPYTDECAEAVDMVLFDGVQAVPEDVEYFCEESATFPALEEVCQIGRHKFWKEKEK